MSLDMIGQLLDKATDYIEAYRYQELFSLIVDSDVEFEPLYELSDLMHRSSKESTKLVLLPTVKKTGC